MLGLSSTQRVRSPGFSSWSAINPRCDHLYSPTCSPFQPPPLWPHVLIPPALSGWNRLPTALSSAPPRQTQDRRSRKAAGMQGRGGSHRPALLQGGRGRGRARAPVFTFPGLRFSRNLTGTGMAPSHAGLTAPGGFPGRLHCPHSRVPAFAASLFSAVG